MGEEQKDALTLACEELCDLTFGNCDTCPIFREDVNGCELMLNAGEPGWEVKDEDCVEKLKQFYKKKASQPDGWDIVNKIVKEYNRIVEMKKNALFMSPYEDNTHLENEIDTLEDIEYIFTDLGIEVDDE